MSGLWWIAMAPSLGLSWSLALQPMRTTATGRLNRRNGNTAGRREPWWINRAGAEPGQPDLSDSPVHEDICRFDVLMNGAVIVDLSQGRSGADREAQEAFDRRGRAEQPDERLAPESSSTSRPRSCSSASGRVAHALSSSSFSSYTCGGARG
jgi:hypothetical protein